MCMIIRHAGSTRFAGWNFHCNGQTKSRVICAKTALGSGSLLTCAEIFLHSGIVNAQKLRSSGCGIHIEMFSLRTLLINETINRIVRAAVQKDHADNLK